MCRFDGRSELAMFPPVASAENHETTPALSTMQEAIASTIRHVQLNGFVAPGEIRESLRNLGLPISSWKEVVAQAKPALRLRHGRYYFAASSSNRLQQEQKQQEDIHRSVRRIIRHYKKAASQVERREQNRLDFIQPVTVRTEEGKEINLLSRDLSATGIRLVGTCRLLGQKVTITIPDAEGGPAARFEARILWTCSVGDGLFENGGRFLEIARNRKPVESSNPKPTHPKHGPRRDEPNGIDFIANQDHQTNQG